MVATRIKTTKLEEESNSLEIDNDFTSARDSSISADPDSYQEKTNPTLAEYNVISNICECFGIDLDLLGIDIEYGVEIPVLVTDVVEIYVVVNHSATAPDANYKISLPVTNGEISAPTFISGLSNVTTEIPIISDCVNFPELAVAIDSGMIQVELSITTTVSGTPALALEITSVATQSETNQLELVLSVGTKIVFSSDSSNYEEFLQAATVLGVEQVESAVVAYQQMIELETAVADQQSSEADSSNAVGYAILAALGVGTLVVVALCGGEIIVAFGAGAAEVISALGFMGTSAWQYLPA